MYENEVSTGKGIAAWLASSGQPRSALFVTSKVLNSIDTEGGIAAACRRSLANLGLDYVDLYLMHAPFKQSGEPFAQSLSDLWKDMETLVADGLVKSIGVSNFRVCDIAEVLATASIPPAINQVERHPCLPQENLFYKCTLGGITLAAYGPLCPLIKADVKATEVRATAATIAATHGAADRTLGRHRQPGGGVGQRGQRLGHVGTGAAHFNAERALASGRQHLGGVKDVANAGFKPQALQARSGQHDAVVLAFVQLAQAGV